MKYKKKSFKEIKKLLSYFIEINEDKSVLSKKYPKDYIVKKPYQWLIIMITYHKITFSANNKY